MAPRTSGNGFPQFAGPPLVEPLDPLVPLDVLLFGVFDSLQAKVVNKPTARPPTMK